MLYNIEVGEKSSLDQILKVNKRIFNQISKIELVDKDSLNKKKYLILVIKEGKTIVGDTISVDRNKNYHILVMALTVNQIKMGIAKRLLDMHKQLAKDNGFKAISITIYDEQKDLVKIVLEEGFEVYRKSLKDATKDYKIDF